MYISVKLNLPPEVIEKYEKEGKLDQVLSERLVTAVNHTAKKPLYINDAQRQRLDRLFGRNFSSTDELLTRIEKALSVRVEDVPVHLSPTLLTRLRSRCFGKTFEEFLAERTVKCLEDFAGMG